MRMAKRDGSGFTLVEMMVVITVIAILSLIVGLALRNAGQRAKESTREGLLHDLNGAVEIYHIDCSQYPATLEDLLATTGPPGHRGYPYYGRGSIPNDPVTLSPFVYDNTTGVVTAPS